MSFVEKGFSRVHSVETKPSAMMLEEALPVIMLDAGMNVCSLGVTVPKRAIDAE